MRKGLFFRLVSILIIESFLLEQVAFAAPELPKLDLFKEEKLKVSFTLPQSVATIQDSWKAVPKGSDPSGTKTLVLIQDAHTNESAQINLSKALDTILEKENIKYVFLEGAFGDSSLSFFKKYGTPNIRKKVATPFLKKGEVRGEEYLYLSSDKDFILWGVEDYELYKKSFESYRQVAKDRDRFHHYLKKIKVTIDTLKPFIFNPLLDSFYKNYESYHEDKLSLTEYFKVLAQEAKVQDVSLNKYPNLRALKALTHKESKINFEKANQEQQKAVASLNPEDQKELLGLAQKKESPFKISSQEHKEGKGFYALLGEKLAAGSSQLAAKNYPELSKYFAYLKLAKKVEAKGVLQEIKELEDEVLDTLAKETDEKTLVHCSKNLRALHKLFNLTLTPEEFDEYKASSDSFTINHLTGFLNKKIMDLNKYYERTVFLEEGYEKIVQTSEQFYELTHERDLHFVQDTLKKMDEVGQTKAVLVTGGYHTQNLKTLLKEKNISYIVVTPQVLAETNQKRYEKILFGENLYKSALGMSALGLRAGNHAIPTLSAALITNHPLKEVVYEIADSLTDNPSIMTEISNFVQSRRIENFELPQAKVVGGGFVKSDGARLAYSTRREAPRLGQVKTFQEGGLVQAEKSSQADEGSGSPSYVAVPPFWNNIIDLSIRVFGLVLTYFSTRVLLLTPISLSSMYNFGVGTFFLFTSGALLGVVLAFSMNAPRLFAEAANKFVSLGSETDPSKENTSPNFFGYFRYISNLSMVYAVVGFSSLFLRWLTIYQGVKIHNAYLRSIQENYINIGDPIILYGQAVLMLIGLFFIKNLMRHEEDLRRGDTEAAIQGFSHDVAEKVMGNTFWIASAAAAIYVIGEVAFGLPWVKYFGKAIPPDLGDVVAYLTGGMIIVSMQKIYLPWHSKRLSLRNIHVKSSSAEEDHFSQEQIAPVSDKALLDFLVSRSNEEVFDLMRPVVENEKERRKLARKIQKTSLESLEDLIKIRGVGQARYSQIRQLLISAGNLPSASVSPSGARMARKINPTEDYGVFSLEEAFKKARELASEDKIQYLSPTFLPTMGRKFPLLLGRFIEDTAREEREINRSIPFRYHLVLMDAKELFNSASPIMVLVMIRLLHGETPSLEIPEDVNKMIHDYGTIEVKDLASHIDVLYPLVRASGALRFRDLEGRGMVLDADELQDTTRLAKISSMVSGQAKLSFGLVDSIPTIVVTEHSFTFFKNKSETGARLAATKKAMDFFAGKEWGDGALAVEVINVEPVSVNQVRFTIYVRTLTDGGNGTQTVVREANTNDTTSILQAFRGLLVEADSSRQLGLPNDQKKLLDAMISGNFADITEKSFRMKSGQAFEIANGFSITVEKLYPKAGEAHILIPGEGLVLLAAGPDEASPNKGHKVKVSNGVYKRIQLLSVKKDEKDGRPQASFKVTTPKELDVFSGARLAVSDSPTYDVNKIDEKQIAELFARLGFPADAAKPFWLSLQSFRLALPGGRFNHQSQIDVFTKAMVHAPKIRIAQLGINRLEKIRKALVIHDSWWARFDVYKINWAKAARFFTYFVVFAYPVSYFLAKPAGWLERDTRGLFYPVWFATGILHEFDKSYLGSFLANHLLSFANGPTAFLVVKLLLNPKLIKKHPALHILRQIPVFVPFFAIYYVGVSFRTVVSVAGALVYSFALRLNDEFPLRSDIRLGLEHGLALAMVIWYEFYQAFNDKFTHGFDYGDAFWGLAGISISFVTHLFLLKQNRILETRGEVLQKWQGFYESLSRVQKEAIFASKSNSQGARIATIGQLRQALAYKHRETTQIEALLPDQIRAFSEPQLKTLLNRAYETGVSGARLALTRRDFLIQILRIGAGLGISGSTNPASATTLIRHFYGRLFSRRPSRVQIEKIDQKRYRLFVDGQEKYMGNGVGYNMDYRSLPDKEIAARLKADFSEMRSLGINSIITWGVPEPTSQISHRYVRRILRRAHRYLGRGSVVLGYWLDQYADWTDPDYRAQKKKEVLDFVRRYKRHPALLMWGFGNENFLFIPDEDLKKAFAEFYEDLVKSVREIDPHHPILYRDTNFVGVEWIQQHIPSLSEHGVYGLNSYGGTAVNLDTIQNGQAPLGIPLLFSEYGPNGPWEDGQYFTEEQKIAQYIDWYQKINQARGLNLGGFAFVWGSGEFANGDPVHLAHFGLHEPDGTPKKALEALKKVWLSGARLALLRSTSDSFGGQANVLSYEELRQNLPDYVRQAAKAIEADYTVQLHLNGNFLAERDPKVFGINNIANLSLSRIQQLRYFRDLAYVFHREGNEIYINTPTQIDISHEAGARLAALFSNLRGRVERLEHDLNRIGVKKQEQSEVLSLKQFLEEAIAQDIEVDKGVINRIRYFLDTLLNRLNELERDYRKVKEVEILSFYIPLFTGISDELQSVASSGILAEAKERPSGARLAAPLLKVRNPFGHRVKLTNNEALKLLRHYVKEDGESALILFSASSSLNRTTRKQIRRVGDAFKVSRVKKDGKLSDSGTFTDSKRIYFVVDVNGEVIYRYRPWSPELLAPIVKADDLIDVEKDLHGRIIQLIIQVVDAISNLDIDGNNSFAPSIVSEFGDITKDLTEVQANISTHPENLLTEIAKVGPISKKLKNLTSLIFSTSGNLTADKYTNFMTAVLALRFIKGGSIEDLRRSIEVYDEAINGARLSKNNENILEEIGHRFEIELDTQMGGGYLKVDGKRRFFRSSQDHFFTVIQKEGFESIEPIKDADLESFLFDLTTVIVGAMQLHPPAAVKKLSSDATVILHPQIDVLSQYTPENIILTVNGDRAYQISRRDATQVTRLRDQAFPGAAIAGLAVFLATSVLSIDDEIRSVTNDLNRADLFAALPSELKTRGGQPKAVSSNIDVSGLTNEQRTNFYIALYILQEVRPDIQKEIDIPLHVASGSTEEVRKIARTAEPSDERLNSPRKFRTLFLASGDPKKPYPYDLETYLVIEPRYFLDQATLITAIARELPMFPLLPKVKAAVERKGTSTIVLPQILKEVRSGLKANIEVAQILRDLLSDKKLNLRINNPSLAAGLAENLNSDQTQREASDIRGRVDQESKGARLAILRQGSEGQAKTDKLKKAVNFIKDFSVTGIYFLTFSSLTAAMAGFIIGLSYTVITSTPKDGAYLLFTLVTGPIYIPVDDNTGIALRLFIAGYYDLLSAFPLGFCGSVAYQEARHLAQLFKKTDSGARLASPVSELADRFKELKHLKDGKKALQKELLSKLRSLSPSKNRAEYSAAENQYKALGEEIAAIDQELTKVIGNFGKLGPEVLPYLLELVQNRSAGRIRHYAMDRIAKLGEAAKDATPALLDLVDNEKESKYVRLEALTALATVNPTDQTVKDKIVSELNNPNFSFIAQAVESLAVIGGEESASVLAEKVLEGPRRFHATDLALKALVRIGIYSDKVHQAFSATLDSNVHYFAEDSLNQFLRSRKLKGPERKKIKELLKTKARTGARLSAKEKIDTIVEEYAVTDVQPELRQPPYFQTEEKVIIINEVSYSDLKETIRRFNTQEARPYLIRDNNASFLIILKGIVTSVNLNDNTVNFIYADSQDQPTSLYGTLDLQSHFIWKWDSSKSKPSGPSPIRTNVLPFKRGARLADLQVNPELKSRIRQFLSNYPDENYEGVIVARMSDGLQGPKAPKDALYFIPFKGNGIAFNSKEVDADFNDQFMEVIGNQDHLYPLSISMQGASRYPTFVKVSSADTTKYRSIDKVLSVLFLNLNLMARVRNQQPGAQNYFAILGDYEVLGRDNEKEGEIVSILDERKQALIKKFTGARLADRRLTEQPVSYSDGMKAAFDILRVVYVLPAKKRNGKISISNSIRNKIHSVRQELMYHGETFRRIDSWNDAKELAERLLGVMNGEMFRAWMLDESRPVQEIKNAKEQLVRENFTKEETQILVFLLYGHRVLGSQAIGGASSFSREAQSRIYEELIKLNVIDQASFRRFFETLGVHHRGFTSLAEFSKTVLDQHVNEVSRHDVLQDKLLSLVRQINFDRFKDPRLLYTVKLQEDAMDAYGMFDEAKPWLAGTNVAPIRNRFASNRYVYVMKLLRDRIVKQGFQPGEWTLTYDYFGSDILTALLLDATTIEATDVLPFDRGEDPGKYESWRSYYITRKAENGYLGTEEQDAFGHVKTPILWELQAMGVSPDSVQIQKLPNGDHSMEFSWSYDGNPANARPRKLIYHQKVNGASIPRTAERPTIALVKGALDNRFERPFSEDAVIFFGKGMDLPGYEREMLAPLLALAFAGDRIYARPSSIDYANPLTGSIYFKLAPSLEEKSAWEVGNHVQEIDAMTGKPKGPVRRIDRVDAERVHFEGDPEVVSINIGFLERRYERVEDKAQGARLAAIQGGRKEVEGRRKDRGEETYAPTLDSSRVARFWRSGIATLTTALIVARSLLTSFISSLSVATSSLTEERSSAMTRISSRNDSTSAATWFGVKSLLSLLGITFPQLAEATVAKDARFVNSRPEFSATAGARLASRKISVGQGERFQIGESIEVAVVDVRATDSYKEAILYVTLHGRVSESSSSVYLGKGKKSQYPSSYRVQGVGAKDKATIRLVEVKKRGKKDRAVLEVRMPGDTRVEKIAGARLSASVEVPFLDGLRVNPKLAAKIMQEAQAPQAVSDRPQIVDIKIAQPKLELSQQEKIALGHLLLELVRNKKGEIGKFLAVNNNLQIPVRYKVVVDERKNSAYLVAQDETEPVAQINGDLKEQLSGIKNGAQAVLHDELTGQGVLTLLKMEKMRADMVFPTLTRAQHLNYDFPIGSFNKIKDDRRFGAQVDSLMWQMTGFHKRPVNQKHLFFLTGTESLSGARLAIVNNAVARTNAASGVSFIQVVTPDKVEGVVVKMVVTDEMTALPVRDNRTIVVPMVGIVPVNGLEHDYLLSFKWQINVAADLGSFVSQPSYFDGKTIDIKSIRGTDFSASTVSAYDERALNKTGSGSLLLSIISVSGISLDEFVSHSLRLPILTNVPIDAMVEGARLAMTEVGSAA